MKKPLKPLAPKRGKIQPQLQVQASQTEAKAQSEGTSPKKKTSTVFGREKKPATPEKALPYN